MVFCLSSHISVIVNKFDLIIFSLSFFGHGYLGEYLSYRYEIFNRDQKHSYANFYLGLSL